MAARTIGSEKLRHEHSAAKTRLSYAEERLKVILLGLARSKAASKQDIIAAMPRNIRIAIHELLSATDNETAAYNALDHDIAGRSEKARG